MCFCSAKEIINILCPAAAQQIRNPNLPIMLSQSGSNHWRIFTNYEKFDFFSLQITSTAKKSNPAAEPHG
jgi:hypothetical protein